MRKFFISGGLSAFLVTGWGLPAAADLTAPQVRDALIAYFESTGYQVSTGSEDYSNGRLEITDLGLSIVIPDEDVYLALGMPGFTIVENNDGSVNVVMPAEIPLTIEAREDDEVVATALAEVSTVNQTIHLSGEPGNIDATLGLDSSRTTITKLTVEGEDIPIKALYTTGLWRGDFSFETLVSGLVTLETDYHLEDLNIEGSFAEPGGDVAVAMNLSIADFDSSADGTVNPETLKELQKIEDSDDPTAALKMLSTIDIDADIELGDTEFDLTVRDRDETTLIAAKMSDAEFGVKFSKDQIAYNIQYGGVDMDITSSEMPLPRVQFNFDDLLFDFDIPLSQGDGPRDFAFKVGLVNFEMVEGLWAMFDPTQQLPRDPATAEVDITGKVLVLLDLLDPANIEQLENMDGPPMLPVSASLNKLLISAVGATLTGSGEASVDFSNPNTVGGFPAPEGSVTLNLKGGFGLMDKLVAMGLVPEDASLGVRAMLGAFAKPIGEDHLETLIELGADGSIKANGQRIQ